MMTGKVLMVIDTQNDFITGSLGNGECQAAVPKIIDLIKNGNYDEVIFTMDTHAENYMDTQEGKKLPVPHCIEGTEGWKIQADIAKAADEAFTKEQQTVIKKPTFGAISLIPKYQQLWEKAQGDLELDFVGFCTGICVLSNVSIAKATLTEAKVCVIEEACACVTPETHKTAIEAMKLIQVDVI